MLKHDFSFLRSIKSSLNPFVEGTELKRIFSQPEERIKDEDKLNFSNLKGILEEHYIQQSEQLFLDIQNKYEPLLKIINQNSQDNAKDNPLQPDWTQPGHFDSPTNPYTVLTAKMSTATVFKFKKNLDLMNQTLKVLHDSVLSMRAGVLSLQNLSLGDLMLLGLQPQNATATSLPPGVSADVSRLQNINKARLEGLFENLKWAPESIQDYQSIEQKDLIAYLIKLQMAKGLFWLKDEFPFMQQHIVSLQVYQHKIRERLYDPDDLSDERAQFI